MASRSSMRSASALLALAACVPAFALQLPAGTEIQIRLKTKVATPTAKAKDAVEAVVIAPVMVDGQFVIPAGAVVRGTVEKAAQSTKPDERSTLALTFTEIEIDGAKSKLAARVTGVENARESVDGEGQIAGILASETISGRLDSGLNKLAERAAGFAGHSRHGEERGAQGAGERHHLRARRGAGARADRSAGTEGSVGSGSGGQVDADRRRRRAWPDL